MKKLKNSCKKIVSFFLLVGIVFVLSNSLVFASSEPSLSISGKVSRASMGGMSLDDVIVEVSGTVQSKAKTDRFGNYIIRNLPRGGTYTIKPIKKGFISSPASRTYRGLMESKINEDYIISEQTFSISGKVLAGGKPVKGIVVMIDTRNNKYFTDQDGGYNIDHLEYNGPYKVSVISDSYSYEPFVVDFLDKDVVHNFTKDIILSGHVTSFDKPVKNVELKVNGINYKTDEDGKYIIKGVSAGVDYKISLSNTDIVSNPAYISLTKLSNDKENLDFDVSAVISGKVTYNGAPFKNAVVVIRELDRVYKTDVNGDFKFTGLPINQQYTVSVTSDGYSFEPSEWKIKDLAVEKNKQNFVASIKKYSATVTAKKGSSVVPGATVNVLEEKKTFVTNAQGKCIINNLKYGKKYTISVKKDGISFVKSKQEVVIDSDIDIVFDSTLTISGSVKNNSKPVANALVVCREQKVKTNTNGNYTLKGLKPNEGYIVSVSSGSLVFDNNTIVVENLTDSKSNVNFVVNDIKEKNREVELSKIKTDAEEKNRIAKEAETAKIKAEKEEQERLVKEAKLKAQEEADRMAEKERLSREIEAAKIKAEEAKLAKEAEVARIKAEKEEQERLAKEAKLKAKEEAKRKAEEAKLAKEAEAARIKAEKEEEIRLAKEAKLKAKEEAKRKAEEAKLAKEAEAARIKAEKEEEIRLAKEAKLKAQEEADRMAEKERLAKEIEAARIKAEEARIVKEAEAARIKAEKEEQERLAKEAKLKAQEEARQKAEEARIAKEAEAARIKAEKEEQERLAKEAKLKAQEELKQKMEKERLDKEAEAARIKAEKEEQERLAKEAKLKAQEEARQKAEEARIAKEAEAARIKAEKEEQERLAKEAKLKAQEELKQKMEKERLAKEAEAARIKAEKEEQERLAKEAKLKAQEEARRKAEEARIAKETESARIKAEKEAKLKAEKESKVFIKGRVLKGKEGISGVQVRVLTEEEEKIFITDKNGFYKVTNLVKGENYTVTVISGNQSYNLYPKVKVYKKISENLTNQNFYIVQDHTKILEKPKETNKKDSASEQEKEKKSGEWYDDYGLQKKNGMLQKQI